MLCAAKSEEMDGDKYIDDGLHYQLSVELEVLEPIGFDGNGAEIWRFCTHKKNWQAS